MQPQNKRRASAAVALALIGPGLVAGLSGCTSSNCDSNRSTPQLEDDCGTGSRAGGRGFWGGSTFRSGSTRGGFGGIGRFFSGGG